MPIKVLCIGDIVGKMGRAGVLEVVPKLRKKHNLDLVIANVENLAHGKGITKKTIKEIEKSGIDIFTSGNHIWKREEGIEAIDDPAVPIIRPANYPEGNPGRGFIKIRIKDKNVLVVNLLGRVFMKECPDDPFRVFDKIIKENKDIDEVIVDFHAEASSEKKAFVWYVVGRASLVFGTHTHIPTADADIISDKKIGYVTDLGMVGAYESVLGVEKGEIIKSFLTQMPVKHKMVKTGKIVFNSILAEINNFKTIHIKRIDMKIEGR